MGFCCHHARTERLPDARLGSDPAHHQYRPRLCLVAIMAVPRPLQVCTCLCINSDCGRCPGVIGRIQLPLIETVIAPVHRPGTSNFHSLDVETHSDDYPHTVGMSRVRPPQTRSRPKTA
jgi:hypothetical protein